MTGTWMRTKLRRILEMGGWLRRAKRKAMESKDSQNEGLRMVEAGTKDNESTLRRCTSNFRWTKLKQNRQWLKHQTKIHFGRSPCPLHTFALWQALRSVFVMHSSKVRCSAFAQEGRWHKWLISIDECEGMEKFWETQ